MQLPDSYRAASEDRAEILMLPENVVLTIIADGVGGRPNGGNAAARAVKLVTATVQAAPLGRLTAPRFWERTLQAVDVTLADDDQCGETTLVAVCVTPTRITGASVGDLEAWWVDDSATAFELTEGAIRKPYLGYGAARPTAFSFAMPRTGTLLVASDGLFKYADPRAIASIMSRGSRITESVSALRDAVRGSSGVLHDDFAVVLLRARASPVQNNVS